jgi:hypothetical protein
VITDWTPAIAVGGSVTPPPLRSIELDVRHAANLGARSNGYPIRAYEWRGGEARQAARIAAVARYRAQLAARIQDLPGGRSPARCPACSL